MIKKIVFALIICSGVSILTDAGAIILFWEWEYQCHN